MSSHYKFEIEAIDDNEVTHWRITRRDGATWTGTFDVVEVCDQGDDVDVAFDINFDNPIDVLPHKGRTLLNQKLQHILVQSITSMVKRLQNDPEYAMELAKQYLEDSNSK